MKNILITTLVAWCALAGVSRALVVNVDIEGGGHTTFSGQGGYADPGNNFWNSSPDGMNNLTASDGTTATTIDVALSTGGRFDYTLSHDLMADYAYANGSAITVDISGLTPNGSYFLYVYGQGDQSDQIATVTFGGNSLSTSGNQSGSLVQGGNYVVLFVTADASGNITGTVAQNGSSYVALNGLQIVETGAVYPGDRYVVNVDINDDSETNHFSGQGVYSDPGNDYWNSITTGDRSLYNLTSSDGFTQTSVDAYVFGGGDFLDGGKANLLLADYFYGSMTAAISGLNPSGNYTVYVYACGDKSGQGSNVTIDNVTKSTTNSGDPDYFSQGVNYVVFQTTADTVGRITIYSDQKLNGFQIVEGDPAQTGHEAEDAVFSGLNVIPEDSASGDECLDGFDAVGETVEYQNVEAGNTLLVRYSNGEAGATRCSVYVNNTDIATAVFEPTGSWSDFATLTVSVAIPTNATVKLQLDADDIAYNSGQDCAIQDKIDVEVVGETIIVDTVLELLEQVGKSNVDVKMTPGVYTLDERDKVSGLLPVPLFFDFSGSGSSYDFSGVTFEVNANLYDEYGSVEVLTVGVSGDNNHIFGLTLNNVGSALPIGTAAEFEVYGDYNKIEECSFYVRTSVPYGYGDLFGKGGGSVINHKKHAALLVEGIGCHILNCYIETKAYGHCIYMGGSVDTLIEGCFIKGQVRSTDEILAEAGTGSPADNEDFMTVWSWDVPPGYMFSLHEGGTRAYNTGGNGRSTANTTVKNCTYENIRTAVPIGFSNNDNYIYGCTVIGNEVAFWPGDWNSVEHCQSEAPYAPMMDLPYQGDNDQTYQVTVLRQTDVYGFADRLAYFGGSSHDITLLNSGIQPRPFSQVIQMGGMKTGMRYKVDPPNYTLSDTTIVNWTDQPVVLSSIASGCNVTSYGAVTDYGSGNSVGSISPVTVTASDSAADRYNTVDGDSKTYWSVDGDGEWIQYDLGITRNLYSVSVKWMHGSARQYDFDIQTSDNAVSWTTVFSGSSQGVTDGWEEYCFHTQNARYIRLVGHGNSYDDTMQIVDFDVDLKDRFAMVKTKSDAGSGFIAQNVFDGNLSTRWAAQGDGQWIQHDLLDTKTINAVGLAWHYGDSRTYSFDVMVSDHPMGPWNTVYSGSSSGTTTDIEEYTFTAVDARFIRITGHGSSVDDWSNLTELFVDAGLMDADSGLVAHWKFEEGSGSSVADSSGNGHDGTFTGGDWVLAPDGGYALNFDGTDATAALPSSAFDSISNEVSVAFWAYGGTSQPANDSVLLVADGSGNRILNIHLPWSDGMVFWDAGNSDGYDRISKAASGDQVSGAWNHWVFTKNAGSGAMNIFLNGELWVSGQDKVRLMNGAIQASLGSGISDLYYEGMLDDVMLYNTALSSNQVTELYQKLTYYRDWAAGEGLVSSSAYVAGNPDGDALENLVEYALGGNPLGNDSVEIYPNAVIPLQESVLEYTYRRRIDAEDRGLRYVVKITDDLTDPNSWSAESITQTEVTVLDAEFESVTVTAAQGTQGFIRLEILMDAL